MCDLQPLCNENATVEIRFEMTAYPDVDRWWDSTTQEQGMHCMAYHHPTFLKLTEGAISWPKPGNIKVSNWMLLSNMYAMPPAPYNETDGSASAWELHATDEEPKYSGFVATYIAGVNWVSSNEIRDRHYVRMADN